MRKTTTIIPAYGRDFKSKREIEGCLEADKDFIVANLADPDDGRYINLSQLKEAGYTSVYVRYGKLTKIASFDIEKLLREKAKLDVKAQ